LNDVPGCGDIGITHPQIHDVFSPAACNLLELIDDGINREMSHSAEIEGEHPASQIRPEGFLDGKVIKMQGKIFRLDVMD
jgi:hypothetical protein